MSKLRIGIVGTGGRGVNAFGMTFVKDHADTTEIIALADPNLVRAEAAMKMLGITADLHDNAEDLITRSDVDAVIIASVDCCHEAQVCLALEHDKHVYIEKPLATTVEGCLRILEASISAGKVLSMGFNLRHNIVIHRLKQLVDEGCFGDIFSIQAIEHYNGGRTYHSRWNRLKKFTGGLFIHKGSHDFDVINYLMGDVRPARVACFANVFSLKPDRLPFATRPGEDPGPNCTVCPYQRECPDAYLYESPLFNEKTAEVDGYYKNQCMYLSEKDTHDQGIAIVEYENGATASHSEYFATPVSNRRYLVEGTKGHGEADFQANSIRCLPRWSEDRIDYNLKPPQGGHGGSDPDIIQTFLDCIATGTRPRASAVDGTWSVAVAVAAEKARAENRVVELSEFFDPDCELLR